MGGVDGIKFAVNDGGAGDCSGGVGAAIATLNAQSRTRPICLLGLASVSSLLGEGGLRALRLARLARGIVSRLGGLGLCSLAGLAGVGIILGLRGLGSCCLPGITRLCCLCCLRPFGAARFARVGGLLCHCLGGLGLAGTELLGDERGGRGIVGGEGWTHQQQPDKPDCQCDEQRSDDRTDIINARVMLHKNAPQAPLGYGKTKMATKRSKKGLSVHAKTVTRTLFVRRSRSVTPLAPPSLRRPTCCMTGAARLGIIASVSYYGLTRRHAIMKNIPALWCCVTTYQCGL